MKKILSALFIVLAILGISAETVQACYYGHNYRPSCRPVEQTGKVQLKKYDGKTGNRLEGAVFTIYNNKGEVVQTIKSDNRGIATSTDISFGIYTIKETQAPSGYSIDPVSFTFVIRCRGQIVNLCFGNRKQEEKGTLKITKVDTDNSSQTLSGAEFEVSDSFGKKQTGTTGTDGTIFFYDLAVGTATIKETKAPAGYTAEKTTSNIAITSSNQAELIVKNKKNQEYGSLKINKIDSENSQPLAGASFEVTDSLGKIQTQTTDSDGTAMFLGVAVGNVYIKETKAPAGYTAEKSDYSASIVSNKLNELTVKNKKNQEYGSLAILKIDNETGAVLSGAEFKVTDTLGNIQTKTTDSDGKITFDDLAVGTATIKETKAPDGYSIDETPTEVTISANTTELVTIKNKKQVGSLEITKVDSADRSMKLPGAKFTITDSKGNNYSGETNEEGILVFQNLSLGELTIIEIEAPGGYVITGEGKTKATIVGNKTTEVTIENQADGGSRNSNPKERFLK